MLSPCRPRSSFSRRYLPIGLALCITFFASPSPWGSPLPGPPSSPVFPGDPARNTPAPKEADLLRLETAIEFALGGNPGLGEIKARAEAMAAIPSQAEALPDPTLDLGVLWLPTNNFDVHIDDFTMLNLGVSQTIPFPGKRGLRKKIAEQEALAAADSLEEARLRLIREVKLAWWRLFYYDRALDLTADAERLLQEVVTVSQETYRVGQTPQQDVLSARLDLSKLKDERLELAGLRQVQEAQLNTLLNRDPDTPISLPREIPLGLPAVNGSELQARAFQERPLFRQHDKLLEAARSKVDLARKEYYPDLTFSTAYNYRWNTPTGRTRHDFLSFGVSLNLPIYAADKQAKAVDQRQSELLQEQYDLQDDHLKVHGEIAVKVAEYRQIRERLLLLEQEILPQSQQTVHSLRAGYAVNTASFADWLRAEVARLRYQAQHWRLLTQGQEILAELAAIVGEDLKP
ncbi:MAG TPA: TolC family protein [Methylococcus sp.]|nr:TolC family protein [Methylococcus sp.]